MISIIVPIYNSEKTLSQCIDSILSQKYSDFEVLLIDDGSTDNSGQICDAYSQKDKRIRVFHQKNQGVSAARNLGLLYINGEFVTFCDSDDWVENTWLLDYINNYHGEDVLYQNAIWHLNNGETLFRNITLKEGLSIREKILQLYCMYTLGYVWAGLFKSEIIKKYEIHFNTNYLYREDMNFALKYVQHISTICILPVRNYHYIYPNEKRNYTNYSFKNLEALIEETQLITNITQNIPNNRFKISGITYNEILILLLILSTKENQKITVSYIKRVKELQVTSKVLPTKFKILHYLIHLSPFIAFKIFSLNNKYQWKLH